MPSEVPCENDDVGEVEDVAEGGDEQAAADREEQRRAGRDEDVERGERRERAAGDVHDRRDERDVENRLGVVERRGPPWCR